MTRVLLKPDRYYTVSKIVAVGRNYAKHIVEMNAQPTDEPVLFLKPPSSIVSGSSMLRLPDLNSEIHHEIELALLVGQKAKNIKKEDWHNYIFGAGIALDLTLRDLQKVAKDRGLPWSVSKGFDGACPLSDFVPLENIPDISHMEMALHVNGELKQQGNTSQMIFTADKLVAYISKIFTLEAGDIILTGTPSGVGPLHSGDHIKAQIENIGIMNLQIA